MSPAEDEFAPGFHTVRVSGLTSGAIYAMVAIGFGVVHNTMGIVNFTQVDFVSLGGMLLYAALVSAQMPMTAALPVAVAGVTLAGRWWSSRAFDPRAPGTTSSSSS